MKFLQLQNNQWIKLESIDAFWFNEMAYNHVGAENFGIEFKVNGYDENSIWFDTSEERDLFTAKLKHYYGGWL